VRIALRELVRRPSRFIAAGGALTLLVVLLLVLGGFLDGLILGSTGAIRAQDQELVAFSAAARRSLARSEMGPDLADQVAEVDGVAGVSGLGLAQTTAAREPGAAGDDVLGVAVAGYDRATEVLPEPPEPGRAVVDRRLQEVSDVELGDRLYLGNGEVEVTVDDWVEDTTYAQQPTVWVAGDTWREVLAGMSPALAVPDDAFQVLLVDVDGDTDPLEVAAATDEATGSTDTVTTAQAIDAIPGVAQQRSAFSGIIGVTFAVAGLVVALFFALITLERTRLYALLKAVGARTSDVFGGVTAQAVGIAVGALIVGWLITWGLVALIPPELPVRLEPVRVAQIALGTLITAVLGSLATLRRILRIEPAQAIG
jgi:putative ABC transport system permease protein